ncbi:MAG TPA: hypothetical protein GX707_20760 [Epulopiscium sp.]|nr:hypothetical protein [Candidatus Epulonipiscium sp.]
MNLISGAIGLVIMIGLLVLFRDKVRNLDIYFKVGIFSVIVALIGYTYSEFDPIGILVSMIAIVVFMMSIILKIYIMIFKKITGPLIKISMFALFIGMVCQVFILRGEWIGLSHGLVGVFLILRNLMIAIILGGILIKTYNIIFVEKNDTINEEE